MDRRRVWLLNYYYYHHRLEIFIIILGKVKERHAASVGITTAQYKV